MYCKEIIILAAPRIELRSRYFINAYVLLDYVRCAVCTIRTAIARNCVKTSLFLFCRNLQKFAFNSNSNCEFIGHQIFNIIEYAKTFSRSKFRFLNALVIANRIATTETNNTHIALNLKLFKLFISHQSNQRISHHYQSHFKYFGQIFLIDFLHYPAGDH